MPFRINPHGADAEWQLVAVVRAVQRLEATTGVDWRFDGYTGERIATGFDPRLDGGRVLIEFTSFDAPGTPSAYGHPKPSGVGDRYLGGYVYLWPSRIRGLSSTQLRALVEHELGHVWGLDHPSAPPEQELMNAAPLRRADYGSGDSELRTLTASVGKGLTPPRSADRDNAGEVPVAPAPAERLSVWVRRRRRGLARSW